MRPFTLFYPHNPPSTRLANPEFRAARFEEAKERFLRRRRERAEAEAAAAAAASATDADTASTGSSYIREPDEPPPTKRPFVEPA